MAESRTRFVPYSEFNQMLKDGEVDSVVVSSNKIEITPKKDSKKYTGSQSKYGGLIGIEYYTIPMYDPDPPDQAGCCQGLHSMSRPR